MITKILKRDGREVPYDREKITNAIFAAAKALGGENRATALELTLKVEDYLAQTLGENIPTVEVYPFDMTEEGFAWEIRIPIK